MPSWLPTWCQGLLVGIGILIVIVLMLSAPDIYRHFHSHTHRYGNWKGHWVQRKEYDRILIRTCHECGWQQVRYPSK